MSDNEKCGHSITFHTSHGMDKAELEKFRKAIESSPPMLVMFPEDAEITFISPLAPVDDPDAKHYEFTGKIT